MRELIVALTYPPALSAALLLMGILLLLFRMPRAGALLLVAAVGWCGLWAVPVASDGLRALVERNHPPRPEEALPVADAIVVLGGGGGYSWVNWENVDPDDLHNSRLAAGARAWLAGRAPRVVLSGGAQGGTTEARRMAGAIAHLGIPEDVLVLEERSLSTEDNARYTAELARHEGIESILLVTSSLHMPRASLLFRRAGFAVTPVPVPERAIREGWRENWLPSRSALRRSGRAHKELLALSIERLRS